MAYEEDLIRGDQELLTLLQNAEPDDVHVLVSFLTDDGKGRLAMSSDVREALGNARKANQYSRDELILVIRELQHFGGNSVVNLVRRNGVPYVEIVSDVLSFVGGKEKGSDIEDLELSVLERLMHKHWSKMSEQDRSAFARQFGDSNEFLQMNLEAMLAILRLNPIDAAKMAMVAVSGIGVLLAEGAFSVGATAIATRAVGLVLGPVAAALAGVAGIHSVTKEAYRITIPCVAQIAYIRQKHLSRSAAEK